MKPRSSSAGFLTLVVLFGAASARAQTEPAARAAKGCNAPAAGCCTALEFGPRSLPSHSGWTYQNLGTGTNQGAAPQFTTQGGWPEAKVFSVNKEGHLVQSTVGFDEFQWGGYNYGGEALYSMPDVVSATAPFTLTARVKVTKYKVTTDENAPNPNTDKTKGYQPGDGVACGFSFGASIAPRAIDRGESYGVCIAPGYAQLIGGTKVVALTPDEAGFSSYQLRVLPGVGAALYVERGPKWELEDRAPLVPEGPVVRPKGWPTELNGLTIGKGTGGANADAEIASFSYCTSEPVAAPARR